MANELLCLFKSSRRTEYTQENLRILSGAIDDELEISYKERWLSEEVRRRLPEAGDPVVIALADPPYAKSHPIRQAEVVAAAFTDDTLRLRLRLGVRVCVDQNRWKPLVQAGPNPKDGQFALRLDVDAGVLEEVTDSEGELKAWKKQVGAVSNADGYARVAFLRVGTVSEVGGTPVDAPYRLTSGCAYQIDVVAYNPHLDGDTLDALRLVAFPEPSLVEVEMDALPIPADGAIELVLVPQDEGSASLEFNVSRGAEFWFALELDWQTTPPRPVVEAPPVVTESSGEAGADTRPTDEPPSGSVALTSDQVGMHLLRGYAVLRGHQPVQTSTRLRVLDEMLRATPGHERLMEQRGIVLHELGQWPEAADLLGSLTPGVLGAEGRTVLVSAWFMQSQVPEPIDRIKIADLSRDEWFDMLLAASKRLNTEQQVAVARLFANSVLAEDRASRWIEPLAMDVDLPRRDRLDLLEIWQYVDPVAAAAGVEELVVGGHIDLADPGFANVAFDLAIEAHQTRLARRAAFALMAHHSDLGDMSALEELLDVVMSRFVREDRREVGEEIVLTIADVVDDDDDIDRALGAAADLIEDQRQRGDLDAAARLAVFATSNEHRATKPVRHHLKDTLGRLQEALDNSKAIQRYQEARRQELNLDLKDLVGGKRVLVLGANEQPWWPDIRQEFGFDASSEWVSTERKKAPPADRIIKKLDSIDLLIVQTGRIGHKTSAPVMKAAKERNLRTITVARPTREAFTMQLRVALGDGDKPPVALPGFDLNGLVD